MLLANALIKKISPQIYLTSKISIISIEHPSCQLINITPNTCQHSQITPDVGINKTIRDVHVM